MTNTSEQPETRKSPKDQTNQPTEALEPAIIGILTEDETNEPITDASTPAEIITDKVMSPEDKKLELQRMWGRKGGLKKKRTTKWKPKFILIARQLASIGVPETDIAALFQVTRGTFNQWKRAHRPLSTALKEGDGLKRTNLLMQMQAGAADGQYVTQIFLAKNWLGMTDKQEQTMKGGQTIIYKSHIPKEKGRTDVDPGSIKGKIKKTQDRE